MDDFNFVCFGASYYVYDNGCMAVTELVDVSMATARFPLYYALKYRTSLGTPIATVLAVALDANDTALNHSFDICDCLTI